MKHDAPILMRRAAPDPPDSSAPTAIPNAKDHPSSSDVSSLTKGPPPSCTATASVDAAIDGDSDRDPYVLRNGEVITAKNTIQSNSVAVTSRGGNVKKPPRMVGTDGQPSHPRANVHDLNVPSEEEAATNVAVAPPLHPTHDITYAPPHHDPFAVALVLADANSWALPRTGLPVATTSARPLLLPTTLNDVSPLPAANDNTSSTNRRSNVPSRNWSLLIVTLLVLLIVSISILAGVCLSGKCSSGPTTIINQTSDGVQAPQAIPLEVSPPPVSPTMSPRNTSTPVEFVKDTDGNATTLAPLPAGTDRPTSAPNVPFGASNLTRNATMTPKPSNRPTSKPSAWPTVNPTMLPSVIPSHVSASSPPNTFQEAPALPTIDSTFTVEYVGTTEVANEAAINAAAAVTCEHIGQRAFQPLPNIRGYRCFLVSPPADGVLPLTLGFNATAISATSGVPNTDEVTEAIRGVFDLDTAPVLIQELQGLAADNPFVATTAVNIAFAQ